MGSLTSTLAAGLLAWMAIPEISQAQITVGGDGASTTDTNNYSGNQTLTKTGSNTVTLTGTSTYSGETTVSAGTLAFTTIANGSASSLGTGADAPPNGRIVIANGNLSFVGNTTQTVNRNIAWTAGSTGVLLANGAAGAALVINDTAANPFYGGGGRAFNFGGTNTDANTYSGVLANQGGNASGLAKFGTGRWILTGNNTYSGATSIYGGTLQIGGGGTSGTLGSGNVVNDGALVFNRSDSFTVGNGISGSGSLTKMGAGTLTLSANNTYTGGTLVTGGNLRIGENGTSGTLGSGNVTNNAFLSFDRIDSVTIGNAISGTGQVNKWGFGTATFTGANTFQGDFVHNYGVTVLNRSGGPALYADGSTGNLVIANQWGGDPAVWNGNWSWFGAVVMGATGQLGANVNVRFEPRNLASAYSYLVLDGKNTTIGNLSSTAPFASSWGVIENAEGGYAGLAASRLTVTQTTNGTFTGEFRDGNWNGGGGIGLTKDGAATLTLASAGGLGISYTGSTIVNAGKLVVNSTNFNSAVTTATGATFEVNATVDQTLKSAVTVSGSGALAKSGAAILTLNSANTHSGGTEVTGGTLQFTNDNQLGAAGGGITLNGGALRNHDSVSTVAAGRTVTLGTNGGFLVSGWGKTTTVAGNVTGAGGAGDRL